MKRNSRNQQGIALAVTLCLVIVGAIGAAAFMYLVRTEIVQVKRQSHSLKAFYAAEAGLETALKLLKNDLYYTPEDFKPDWADNKLYYGDGADEFIDLTAMGYPKNLDPANPDYEAQFYTIPVPPGIDAETEYESEGNGKTTYEIQLSNLEGWSDRIWVKSIGRYYKSGSATADPPRTILSLVGAMNMAPWNYAIFANTGQDGMAISGNVDIRGSVHILGESLGPTDLAAEFSGTGGIGNNYDRIPAELGDRLPSIQRTFYMEDGTNQLLDSLETVVAIQHGQLSLSGTGTVGDPHVDGNGLKELITGVYIGDQSYEHYTGNQGSKNVYSDNGIDNDYVFEDLYVPFPWLTGHDYSTECPDYLKNFIHPNSLKIYDDLTIRISKREGESGLFLGPQADVPYQLPDYTPEDPYGRWNDEYGIWNAIGFTDPTSVPGGLFTFNGMILVYGDVKFEDYESYDAIVYDGIGTITAAKRADGTGGNVTIECNLLSLGAYQGSYPCHHILGIMAEDTISLIESDTNLTGLFYAQEKIVSTKQTSVAGSFVSNYFEMGIGNNVPAIYQVPEAANHFPYGMIGSERAYGLRKLTWREIGHVTN